MFGIGRKKHEELDRLLRVLVAEPVVAIVKTGVEGPIETTTVDFIMLLIEEADRDRFSSLASQATQIAVKHDVILVANAGGLMQLAVGPRTDSKDVATLSSEIVGELACALGAAAKILYGRATSHVGTVGVDERKTWGYFPIAITSILKRLIDAKPGVPVAWDGNT